MDKGAAPPRFLQKNGLFHLMKLATHMKGPHSNQTS